LDTKETYINKGEYMLQLQGKYTVATVYTDNIEQEAIAQIIELCNQEFVKDKKVAIMPDVHAGKGCVIGFTADLGDKVIPNIVGVDLGCGVLCVNLGNVDLDLAKLDDIIRKYIPAGFNVHEGRQIRFDRLKELHCYRDLKDTKRLERSIGTLGGGNHYLEVDTDETNKYLVIHSGSRNLGTQVADYYQRLAIQICSGKKDFFKAQQNLIETYKALGKRKEIKKALQALKEEYTEQAPKYPRHLCFLEGEHRDKYLHDMQICQEYASLSRKTMADIILNHLLKAELDSFEHFETIHNYINFTDNIIRKGSISAREGEKVLIPINMRDGSILAIGKGNPDWNFSAPHGAGRLMSRSKAKELITLEDYKSSMTGIYSTSVGKETIDEAPQAYKPMQEILDNIGDTVDVIGVIKPIYNFKAH
jgi:RNA-splicing ligase RtcB